MGRRVGGAVDRLKRAWEGLGAHEGARGYMGSGCPR